MWRGNREDAVARRMNSRDLGSMEWKNPGKPGGRLNLQDMQGVRQKNSFWKRVLQRSPSEDLGFSKTGKENILQVFQV